MRHFAWMTAQQEARLFHVPPTSFNRHSDLQTLGHALGATLYMPGNRPTLAQDVRAQAARGVTSVSLCLEDAVPDDAVPLAEARIVAALHDLSVSGEEQLPLVFVRVRDPAQLAALLDRLEGCAPLLTGFVLPKFDADTGAAYLEILADARQRSGAGPLAMPVLETPQVAYRESRLEALLEIHRLLDKYRDLVIAVRIGAVDLLAAHGLRRAPGLTAYEMPMLAGVLADAVNVLGRCDGSGFVLTGTVWEHFGSQADPAGIQGLLRETLLDRANGLIGKTVIHPSQVLPVHAASVVLHDDYLDATQIMQHARSGGAFPSARGTRMNEARPHSRWAARTLLRAELFGVAAAGIGPADILAVDPPGRRP